jgi:hypothetical protein
VGDPDYVLSLDRRGLPRPEAHLPEHLGLKWESRLETARGEYIKKRDTPGRRLYLSSAIQRRARRLAKKVPQT